MMENRSFIRRSRMRITALAGVFLILCMGGCVKTTGRTAAPRGLKGSVNAEGHLVFFEWTTHEGGERHRYAALRDDYGMMIFYDASAENRAARFELYCFDDKRIYETQRFDEFKAALGRIRPGRRLHYYNTCGGGTHHGLDGRYVEEIKELCRAEGIVFQRGDDKVYVICTCP